MPYDSEWKKKLAVTPDVPPYTLRLHSIQCVVPSSGMVGATVFGTVVGIIESEIGATAGAIIVSSVAIATGGAAQRQ